MTDRDVNAHIVRSGMSDHCAKLRVFSSNIAFICIAYILNGKFDHEQTYLTIYIYILLFLPTGV